MKDQTGAMDDKYYSKTPSAEADVKNPQGVNDYNNQESGIDSSRKKFSCGKDPERHIPGRYTFTITICNIDDTTQSHLHEMHNRVQTQ